MLTAKSEEADQMQQQHETKNYQFQWTTLHQEKLNMSDDGLEHVANTLQAERTYMTSFTQRSMSDLKKTEFSKGPCFMSLEPLSQKFKVQRQAYHSDACTGNHINIALRENMIEGLVSAMKACIETSNVSQQQQASLLLQAQQISDRYHALVSSYTKAREMFSSPVKLNEFVSLLQIYLIFFPWLEERSLAVRAG